MRGFSKVILAGNLVRDPEMRATTTGSQACNFTIAVNRVYKGSDGSAQEQVSYIDCVAWGKPGETISQYTRKGSGIIVSGRLDQRSWEDKNTGQRRSRIEVVVEDFSFIGGSSSAGGDGSYSSSSKKATKAAPAESTEADDFAPDDMPEDGEINLDDIPF